ncbi:hypothetical protein ACFL49_02855 [Candidatus Omnitrophota bacterium]
MLFRRWKEWFKTGKSTGQRLRENKGQIAIMLILAIAVLFIFYAMALNLGKVSDLKILVTRASTSAASVYSAQIGGMAESYFRTALGGRIRYCRSTSIWGAIFAFIVIIVATYVSAGKATGPVMKAMLAVAVVMAAASLVMQVVVVQPGITSAWNKMMTETMTDVQRFLEVGLQTALTTVVTDQEKVPDWIDMDMDAQVASNEGDPEDTVSRFSHYYTMRLLKSQPNLNSAIGIYLAEMTDLLYGEVIPPDALYADTDNWGLYDPPPCWDDRSNPCCYLERWNRPSECNSCCEARQLDSANDECVVGYGVDSASCERNSPFEGFPNVYEPVFDNIFNNDYINNPADYYMSFRELVGRDDEHKEFIRDPDNINDYRQLRNTGALVYRVEDTTGYQRNDIYDRIYPFGVGDYPGNLWDSGQGEVDLLRSKGVFPFLYKYQYWGLSLDDLGPEVNREHCHWYDTDIAPVAGCGDFSEWPRELYDFEGGSEHLKLPRDPAGLICQKNAFVDNRTVVIPDVPPEYSSLGACNPGIAPDKVVMKQHIWREAAGVPYVEAGWSFIAQRDATDGYPNNGLVPGYIQSGGSCATYMPGVYKPWCHQESLKGFGSEPYEDAQQGVWKKGVDRYCQGGDPYHAGCYPTMPGEDPPRECICAETGCVDGGGAYQTDPFDMIAYDLNHFILWARDQATKTAGDIFADYTQWYVEAAEFMENTACYPVDQPVMEHGAVVTVPGMPGECYSKCDDEDPSLMRLIRPAINGILGRVQTWLTYNYSEENIDNVWCVPPDLAVYREDASPEELASFGSGDINSVWECLSWNAYDVVNSIGEVDVIGNDQKFDVCADVQSCLDHQTFCSGQGADFPRCVFSEFDDNFLAEDIFLLSLSEDVIQEFEDCLVAIMSSAVPEDKAPVECTESCGAPEPVVYEEEELESVLNCETVCSQLTLSDSRFQNLISSNYKGGEIRVVLESLEPASVVMASETMECFIPCVVDYDFDGIEIMGECSSPCESQYEVIENRESNSCNPATEEGQEFYRFVVRGLSLAKGSCTQDIAGEWCPQGAGLENAGGLMTDADYNDCYFDKNGYNTAVSMCGVEAENQVAKFRIRANFLGRRIAEAEELVEILNNAASGPSVAFPLGGPLYRYEQASDALIRETKNYYENVQVAELQPEVIYGWRDDPPEGSGAPAEWHLVKAEGKIPTAMPYVSTYTKDWGTTRCYELRNHTGQTKARVTRADQGKVKAVAFPGGQKIWDFRTWKGAVPTANRWNNLNNCVGEGSGPSLWVAEGAFMLNTRGQGCWNQADAILSDEGLSVTMCARYYITGGGEQIELDGKCAF